MKHRFYPPLHNGRFSNIEEKAHSPTFLMSCYMFLKFYFNRQKRVFHKKSWIATEAPVWNSSKTSVVWIGHATFIIQIGGLTILTDPVFSDISFFCKRITPPGLPLTELPKIDLVLISHNHWDHLDLRTLRILSQKHAPLILVPIGDKKHLENKKIPNVKEYTWWEQENIGGVECSFLPSHHWSQRSLFDKNRSLWGSWMIRSGDTCIYFAGDTAYSSHFSAIAQEFPLITLALMPIGPCEPKEWMRSSHVTAEEAVQGFQDLKARHFIPMHWGTFHFGTDDTIAPLERLSQEWERQQVSQAERTLHLVKLGEQRLF